MPLVPLAASVMEHKSISYRQRFHAPLPKTHCATAAAAIRNDSSGSRSGFRRRQALAVPRGAPRRRTYFVDFAGCHPYGRTILRRERSARHSCSCRGRRQQPLLKTNEVNDQKPLTGELSIRVCLEHERREFPHLRLQALNSYKVQELSDSSHSYFHCPLRVNIGAKFQTYLMSKRRHTVDTVTMIGTATINHLQQLLTLHCVACGSTEYAKVMVKRDDDVTSVTRVCKCGDSKEIPVVAHIAFPPCPLCGEGSFLLAGKGHVGPESFELAFSCCSCPTIAHVRKTRNTSANRL